MDKKIFWQRFILKFFLRQPLIVHNSGWTLIEIAAVCVVAGILAAMAFPSLAGIQGRNELRSTMSTVKSAFQETQRNAIKMGISCTVTVNPNTKTITASPVGCLTNSVTLSSGITFEGLSSNVLVPFSYKGNTSTNQTFVLTFSSRTSEKRCLVIASGLGLMRSGTYAGSTCTTNL